MKIITLMFAILSITLGVQCSENIQIQEYKKPNLKLSLKNSSPKILRFTYLNEKLEPIEVMLRPGKSLSKINIVLEKPIVQTQWEESWKTHIIFFDESKKQAARFTFSASQNVEKQIYTVYSSLYRKTAMDSMEKLVDDYYHARKINNEQLGNVVREEYAVDIFFQGNDLEYSTLDVVGSIK